MLFALLLTTQSCVHIWSNGHRATSKVAPYLPHLMETGIADLEHES